MNTFKKVIISLTLLTIYITKITLNGENLNNKLYPATIKEYHGVPTLFINESPVYFNAFRPYPVAKPSVISAFAKAGVHIHFPFIYLGEVWTGENTFNYSIIDSSFEQVLKIDSDAYFIPQIIIYGKMEWWLSKHPEERTIDGLNPDCTAPVQPGYVCISFSSSLFRRESTKVLIKIIRHIEKSGYADRILGYQISHGAYGEWIYWGGAKPIDFNPQFIVQFRIWLKNKYKNENSLKSAWKDNDVTFENATPSRKPRDYFDSGYFLNPVLNRQLIDTKEFISYIITKTTLYYAKVIKEVTNNRALVGLYGGANYRQQHLKEQMLSPYIDFFCSSTGYWNRGIDGVTWDQGFALESLKAHDKLYFHDADIRTYLFPEDANYGRCSNVRDSIMVLRREFGAMLTRGYGITWFNIQRKPAFHNPAIMRDICRMNKIGRVSLDFDRSSQAEIAVIVRQQYARYAGLWYAASIREELYRIGAPCDIYVDEDIDSIPLNRYKLIIFLFTQYLSPETIKKIEKFKSDGRIIIWSYGTGFITDEGFSIGNMQRVTGFKFKREKFRLFAIKLSKYPFKILHPGDVIPLLGQLRGPKNVSTFIVLDEKNLKILGRVPASDKIVFAMKDMGNWTSVYFPGYAVQGSVIREFARQAGIHIYYDYNDGFFYSNKNFIVFGSGEEGGKRKISFPKKVTVYDVFKQEIIAKNVDTLTLNLEPRTTNIYFVGNDNEVVKFKDNYEQNLCMQSDWTWTKKVDTFISFEIFPQSNITTIMQNSIKNFKVRILSYSNDITGKVYFSVPEGWNAEVHKFGPLRRGEVFSDSLGLSVPKNASPGRYRINAICKAFDKHGKSIELTKTMLIDVSTYTYLSDIEWTEAYTGWGTIRKDRSVDGNPISLAGNTYRKGLGCHAPSKITYELGGKWSFFEAIIGIDDEAGKGYSGHATATFQIWADGKKVYDSGKLTGWGIPKKIKIDIKGVKKLELITTDAGDGKGSDHTDWADAKLIP